MTLASRHRPAGNPVRFRRTGRKLDRKLTVELRGGVSPGAFWTWGCAARHADRARVIIEGQTKIIPHKADGGRVPTEVGRILPRPGPGFLALPYNDDAHDMTPVDLVAMAADTWRADAWMYVELAVREDAPGEADGTLEL